MTTPTVLTILADEFEEIEAFASVDLLRRAKIEVTVASLNENRHSTGRSGITAHADVALSAVDGKLFDLLFLPGGAGVKHLRADSRVTAAVMRHHEAGKWLAAICAAPTVLNDCGLLRGKRYTAHFSVASELADIRAGERIVTDGKIITSRGAGTAVEFGLHLVSLLTGPGKAEEIGKSICI
ncbi:MAG TPA: DJ-1 family glyoxalase III [Lacunisphaera sp.]|jgi:4-methyl-5(b-hydroxyethyl)-thiazole monophosphate biosynthesis